MPTNPPEPVGVPERAPLGPTARVTDEEAERLRCNPDFVDAYAAGQEAARAGKAFWIAWEELPRDKQLTTQRRYAFQAGWERP